MLRKDQGVAVMSRPAEEMSRAREIAARVERFVRDVVVPYERDLRVGPHGPSEELVVELRGKAKAAGVLTPHILHDGEHLTQRETATVLKPSGLSPLGPVAVNTMAPDEGNMYLLGKIATAEQKARFLAPLISGEARSAFFMTEPAEDDGAGSDPSMMKTVARLEGDQWVVNGRKAFITRCRRSQGRHHHGEIARRAPRSFWLICPIRPFESSECSTPSIARCRADTRWSTSTTSMCRPIKSLVGAARDSNTPK